jgi:hypothetical protein
MKTEDSPATPCTLTTTASLPPSRLSPGSASPWLTKTKALILCFFPLILGTDAQTLPCGAPTMSISGTQGSNMAAITFFGINSAALFNGNAPQYMYEAMSHTIVNLALPIDAAVAQVISVDGVPQDGPATYLDPASPEFRTLVQQALVWGCFQYQWTNGLQSNLIQDQDQFQQAVNGQWIQEIGVGFAETFAAVADVTQDIISLVQGQGAAEDVGNMLELGQDLLQLYSKVESDFTNNAPNILAVLTRYGVVGGQDFSSAQLISGLASLTTTNLPGFEAELYAAAFPDQAALQPGATQYVSAFFQNLGAATQNGLISASGVGLTTFLNAYALNGLPLEASASGALQDCSAYFEDGLPALAAVFAADEILQSYVLPQAHLVQDIVSVQDMLTTNLFPGVSAVGQLVTTGDGEANFPMGADLAAEVEVIRSFEYLWCVLVDFRTFFGLLRGL